MVCDYEFSCVTIMGWTQNLSFEQNSLFYIFSANIFSSDKLFSTAFLLNIMNDYQFLVSLVNFE